MEPLVNSSIYTNYSTNSVQPNNNITINSVKVQNIIVATI